jgi:magnesium transporter
MSIQSLTVNGITWYHTEQPEEADLLKLHKKYKFHQLDLEDCMSENERPKIEEYPEYLFFVIHLPVKIAGRMLKEEVNIFLGKDFVVTLAEGKSGAIDNLWKLLKHSDTKRDEYFQQGSGFFLYKLLDMMFDKGFPLIDGIMKELRRIEVELFEREEGQINILRDILTLKRNIITMRSILFPQRSVVALLQHKNKDLIPSELNIYFDDVADAIERQWALLDTGKEMSDALQETHESWLSHRTNEVVRVLTIFSVTMVPLTFISSLYGMNVHLPYQESVQAFPVLVLVMTLIMSGLLGYFAWKKWL